MSDLTLDEAAERYEDRRREAAVFGKRFPAYADLEPEQRAIVFLLLGCDCCGRALIARCCVCDNDT